MSLRWIVVTATAILAAIVFAVLLHSDPPAEVLSRPEGVAYHLSLTRFSKGEGLTCPPFRLDISFDRQPDLKRQLLLAEQADDVIVAQTPSTIYIFYNELVLNNFGSWSADARDAKPLLCDTNIPICANEIRGLAHAGIQMQRICGRERQP